MAEKMLYESVKGCGDVVEISMDGLDQTQAVFDRLLEAFEACFRDGKTKIIVDLKNVQFPTASIIALLVEATSRARRSNGDVKIINLSKSAKGNLTTFSPASYLSVEVEKRYALEDFQETGEDFQEKNMIQEEVQKPTEPPDEISEPIQDDRLLQDEPIEQEKPELSQKLEEETKPKVDIAEDPFIEQLENSFQNDQGELELTSKTLEDFSPSEPTTPVDRKEEPPGPQETLEEEATYLAKKQHLRVKSIANNLYSICDFVTDYAEKAGFDTKEVGKTKIAVYEASLNVIEHAYRSNPENWIDVWVEFVDDKLIIEIKDYGFGFEGFSNKNYDVHSAMNKEQTGGFGLYIIRRSMDEVEYVPDKTNGNRLKMVKYLKPIRK